MTAIPEPTEEEKYLIAMLDDPSGIELAEFSWIDEEKPDRCYRVWDFQWAWFRNEATYQIDFAGRSLGKSTGIQMRAFAFPFCFPGQEMLVTAPELNHLRPVVDKIEHQILSHRISREMLPKQRGRGINHQPQFQVHFANNARIISRLPQRDGKGVKTCCIMGTLVTTVSGQIPIEEIRPGDYVLTDRRRYMPVTHVYRYDDTPTLEVAGAGHRGLGVSHRHSFLARRNRNPQRTRNLEPEGWVHADDPELNRHYWATPTEFPLLELPDVPTGVEDAVPLLELAGRYAADGHVHRAGVVAWTDEEPGVQHIEQLCKELGYRPYRQNHPHNAAVQTAVASVDLQRWLVEHFGRLAAGKKMPSWLLGAPPAAQRAFLDGYLAGDGHWSESKRRWEVGTASKPLAVGVKLLAQALGYGASYSWVDPQVTQICGRELLAAPQRSHRVQITAHGHAIADDGMRWGKIRSVTPSGQRTVYDLAVAQDHSYVGDGIVHLGTAWAPDGTEV